MALELNDVSVMYGRNLNALSSVNLSVTNNSVVALLGANGAGKTTALRAISRNLGRHSARMTSGSIIFDGTDISRFSVSDVVARGIVQVPEGRRIFGRLSVEENLRIGGMRRNRRDVKASLEKVYELFPMLAERHKQQGLLLSGGEQQMLAIGRGLMADPKLLMLDEPSLGLAPIIVEQISEIITSISESGVSILLIEQNANMALSISDTAYVLELGSVSLSGKSSELAQTDEVQHLYLGHSGGKEALQATQTVPAVVKTLKPWEGRR